MLELSNRISNLVFDALESQGIFNSHELAKSLLPSLTDDERDWLVGSQLALMIKQKATRTKKEIEQNAEQQGLLSFPGLNIAYTLKIINENGEEENQIKKLELLNKSDLEYVIAIRKESIANDQAHVTALEKVLFELAPFWEDSPALTLEQVVKRRKHSLEPELDLTSRIFV